MIGHALLPLICQVIGCVGGRLSPNMYHIISGVWTSKPSDMVALKICSF
jgi:hypothetical protein